MVAAHMGHQNPAIWGQMLNPEEGIEEEDPDMQMMPLVFPATPDELDSLLAEMERAGWKPGVGPQTYDETESQ